MSDLIGVDEAAQQFGVRPQTMRSWCSRKLVRHVKPGKAILFKQEWLDELLERLTINPIAHQKAKVRVPSSSPCQATRLADPGARGIVAPDRSDLHSGLAGQESEGATNE